MTLLIILFGILIIIAGAWLLIDPKMIMGFLASQHEQLWIHCIAVVTRIVLGMALIMQSSVSRFPTIIEILGWLAIIAAIVLAVIGRGHFKRLMNWLLTGLKPYARFGGLISTVFGGFLIYAFI